VGRRVTVVVLVILVYNAQVIKKRMPAYVMIHVKVTGVE
jgi:hypothetical protein